MKIEIETDYLLEFMDKHWEKVTATGKADDEKEIMFHDGMMYIADVIISEFGIKRDNMILFSQETGRHQLCFPHTDCVNQDSMQNR